MTITGKIKFFDLNQIDENITPTLTSANVTLISYIFDNDRLTQLTSIGSDDVTPEVWTLVFASEKTFNRIFIDNHNIKAGTLKYWNGATFVDFSTPISWAANTDTTNYYEFDSISTLRVQLTMNTTQTVDAQKVVGQLRCFVELATLNENPNSIDQVFEEAARNHTSATGGNIHVFFGQKYNADIEFSDADDTDIATIKSLKDNGRSFYIWNSGGITTRTQIGFRVQDMFLVNYVNPFNPNLKSQLFGIGTTIDMEVAEV